MKYKDCIGNVSFEFSKKLEQYSDKIYYFENSQYPQVKILFEFNDVPNSCNISNMELNLKTYSKSVFCLLNKMIRKTKAIE